MPNVSEGGAIVISAFISVAGMVITVIASQFFNWRQRISDFEYQYSIDMNNKKLALYGEVVRELDSIRNPDTRLLYMSSFRETDKKISTYIHTLYSLIDRLHLYGSPDSRKILYSCINEIQHNSSEAVEENMPDFQAGSFYWSVLNNIVRNTMIDFTNLVSSETRDGFFNIKRPKHRSKSKITKQTNRKSGDNLNSDHRSPE
jgi:hypothetical protein